MEEMSGKKKAVIIGGVVLLGIILVLVFKGMGSAAATGSTSNASSTSPNYSTAGTVFVPTTETNMSFYKTTNTSNTSNTTNTTNNAYTTNNTSNTTNNTTNKTYNTRTNNTTNVANDYTLPASSAASAAPVYHTGQTQSESTQTAAPVVSTATSHSTVTAPAQTTVAKPVTTTNTVTSNYQGPIWGVPASVQPVQSYAQQATQAVNSGKGIWVNHQHYASWQAYHAAQAAQQNGAGVRFRAIP